MIRLRVFGPMFTNLDARPRCARCVPALAERRWAACLQSGSKKLSHDDASICVTFGANDSFVYLVTLAGICSTGDDLQRHLSCEIRNFRCAPCVRSNVGSL